MTPNQIKNIIDNTLYGVERVAKAEELLKNNPEMEEGSKIIDANMKEENGVYNSFQSFIKSQREANSEQMLQK